MMELTEIAQHFGIWVAIVVSFLYRDYHRERKLDARIATLEEETRSVLLPLVKDCTAVIARNTLVMERLEEFLDSKHEP